MNLKPIPAALGIRPDFWARWTVNSKNVLHMEVARRVGYVPTLSRGLGRDPRAAVTEFIASLGVQGVHVANKET